MAFGLPILQHILDIKSHLAGAEGNVLSEKPDGEPKNGRSTPLQEHKVVGTNRKECPLLALVMAPTRELALQVKDHLQQVAKYTAIKVE